MVITMGVRGYSTGNRGTSMLMQRLVVTEPGSSQQVVYSSHQKHCAMKNSQAETGILGKVCILID